MKFNSLLTDTPCNCQNQAISSTSTVSSIKIVPSLQTTTYKTNSYNQINGSPCQNTFRKTCLDMHNKYRAIHQGKHLIYFIQKLIVLFKHFQNNKF